MVLKVWPQRVEAIWGDPWRCPAGTGQKADGRRQKCCLGSTSCWRQSRLQRRSGPVSNGRSLQGERSGGLASLEVARLHRKIPRKKVAVVETGKENVIFSSQRGDAGVGAGPRSITGREVIMVVPVQWLKARRLTGGSPKWRRR